MARMVDSKGSTTQLPIGSCLVLWRIQVKLQLGMGRKSDSRQRLIDAAHELIWSYSYGSVTIEAICDRAGVKKGSFYYFFDSKSDLAFAAISAWWVERKQLIEDLVPADAPLLDRVLKYLDYVTENQLEDYEENGQVLGCPLFTLGSEICTQDGRLTSLIQEILTGGARLFEQAIREAQASGEVAGSNAEVKGRLLWAYYEGTLTRARIENNPELIRRLSSDALELIGLRPHLAEVA
jgi:TetR/AcrR family transcriptional repressor of nem operon